MDECAPRMPTRGVGDDGAEDDEVVEVDCRARRRARKATPVDARGNAKRRRGARGGDVGRHDARDDGETRELCG